MAAELESAGTIIASLGVGGLITASVTAWLTHRGQRSQQYREALLTAAGAFADRAVAALDGLRMIRPPREGKTHNIDVIKDASRRRERLEMCAERISSARSAVGRLIVLCGPESEAATQANEFYVRANEAQKIAAAFYRELPESNVAVTHWSDETDAAFRKERDLAGEALDRLGAAVSPKFN